MYLRFVYLLLLAVSLGGCGGGGNGNESGNRPNTAPIVGAPAHTPEDGHDLSQVDLAIQAEQLARIPVHGLPSAVDVEQLYAEYHLLADADIGKAGTGPGVLPVYIEGDTSDAVYLQTPLIDPEGGEIVLVITDGASRSTAFGLKLLPLPPPRAGAVDTLIDRYDDLMRAITEALGKEYPQEWENWRDQGFNQIPDFLLPLMRSWLAVLDPENDHALINQTLEPEAKKLLEAC